MIKNKLSLELLKAWDSAEGHDCGNCPVKEKINVSLVLLAVKLN